MPDFLNPFKIRDLAGLRFEAGFRLKAPSIRELGSQYCHWIESGPNSSGGRIGFTMQIFSAVVRKVLSDNLNERFEITKKFSDYIGMVTRIVFIWVAVLFYGKYIKETSSNDYILTYISKHVFYYIIFLFALSFSFMFIAMTMHAIDEAFRLRSWRGMQGKVKITAYIAYSLLIGVIWTAVSNAFVTGIYPLLESLVSAANIAK